MDYAERVREELKTRCVWLRTKAAYLPLPSPGTPDNPYSTAIWWCLKSGEALGPTGATACPGACDRAALPCYEGPVRL